jgi:CelD/BcsL family acetyltransferase involved in cellulose biosynthesis
LIAISAEPVRDWDGLGTRWRALEALVPASFFQSWTWIGCLAAERYPDPWLIEARNGAGTIGLALFNRRGHRLVLHDSGDPVLDCPYIEHNGVLGGPAAPMLQSALAGWMPRRLVLHGVDDATLAAVRVAAPLVRVVQSQDAPFVDLSRDFLTGRSANTRQQLRRSDRAYGTPTVHRAETNAEAFRLLDELGAFHQQTWTARGKPGAFARPFFGRFHRALIERGLKRGEVDLLRVSAGDAVVGVLYNFRFRGQMLAYQSGFNYPNAGTGDPRKPGLTCHHAAIRLAVAAGLERYDFLAGEARYKRSLSDGAAALHWIEAGSRSDIKLASRIVFSAVRKRSVLRLRQPGVRA